MKKLLFAMASLCLVVSVSSCSADDFTEELNSREIQNKEIVNPKLPSSLENGDDDDDDDKGTTGDKD